MIKSRQGLGLLLGLWFSLLLVCPPAQAEPAAFGLVVGNNTPPQSERFSDLPRLRYADDDAVRWAGFLDRFAERVELLAVLDDETQRRYPGQAERAKPPTVENLQRAMASLVADMEKARAAGRETIFYLAWSGHGAVTADGQAFLALLDGGLNRDQLRKWVLEPANADFTHLVVDACHAGALVGSRGMFDAQRDATLAPVAPSEVLEIVQSTDAERMPGLGVLIATSADQETNEWSRIQAGVFTHEVLSGLSGAADVNADGQVEYSEIHAFVAAANREVPDPRAVPKVIARPPSRDLHAPLVDLTRLKDVVWLRGDPSRLGRFHIELTGGQRYLDAHLALGRVAIAMPAGIRAFLRTRGAEAELGPDGGSLAKIRLSERPLEKKGSVDAALRGALFSSPFGETYYKGFVDSRGLVGVRFGHPAIEIGTEAKPASSIREPLAITCWVAAGGALLAAAITGGLTVDAWQDFKATDMQRPAHLANKRYQTYGNAAIISGLGAVALATAGWLLWPEEVDGLKLGAAVGPGGFALSGQW